MKIVVLDAYTLNPGDLDWTPLRDLGDIQIYDRTDPASVIERAIDAEILLLTKVPLDRARLAQLPRLRYIGVLATGYDMIDREAARERNIPVTNIPSYGTDSVAQFVFALLLELCHQTGMHSDAVRAGEWSRNPDWSFWKSAQIELAGKIMGIIGFGRIGRRTAEIARTFGMRVIAADERPREDEVVERWTTIEDLLAQSDVVSLHCPLTPATRGLINSERLQLMRRSAFLINASRGPLVVERDLADALNSGKLAGAAVDVLSTEPPPEGNPLFTARNCIVTPHMAWATCEARTRLLKTGAENVQAFLQGRPRNVVNGISGGTP